MIAAALSGMARVFTKHKQVIISVLCPKGMGVAGVDVVLVSIGEAVAYDRPIFRLSFWSRMLKVPPSDCTGVG